MSEKKDDEAPVVKRAQRELVQFRLLPQKSWLGGVCSALAYKLGLPTWLVRLIWAVAVLCYGTGALLYVILWVFVPNADRVPKDYAERTGDTE
jgi:phage shock protein C